MRKAIPIIGRLQTAAICLLLLHLLPPAPCLAASPPPVITVQPFSQTAQIQGTVTFTVQASSGTTLSYKWLKNNTTISGATLSSYTISSVRASDAATYAAKVTNAGGTVTSANATLTVLLPPTITTPPQSQTTTQGLTAAFSVVASGTAPISYQWCLNGAALSGATDAALALTNVQTTDAGNYTVVVTNLYGSATTAVATLTVLVPPAITTQPQSQAVTKGQNASFSVEANGSPPLTYQWYFNGIKAGGTDKLSTFPLDNVDKSKAGNYTVVVANQAGSVTSMVATLTVYVPPVIQTQPKNLTVTQGQNATNSVFANGSTPFSYQWNLNASPIPGATDASLVLTNVQAADSGSYTVAVTNPGGSITSQVATLTVNVPAGITTQPQNQTVVIGQTASFSVIASGTPNLIYQWYFNSAKLGGGSTSSTLALSNVGTNDAGKYTVVVNNNWGSVTSTVATLTVVASTSITTQPQSLTATQGLNAAFSVVASGEAPLSYQWQYSGQNIAGATNATLVLTNVQLGQAGNYLVTVANPWNTATSAAAFLTVVVPPGTDQPTMQGLVAHLTFDADLTDSSGRGNHAAAVGAPNLVPGFIGAGAFNPFTQDGTNNYATFGTPSDLSFGSTSDFSIAFWARLPAGGWGGSSSYSDPPFISNKDWSSSANTGWVLATRYDGELQWNYREAGQSRINYGGPAGVFGNPVWHHVAVTFQRKSINTATAYFDGVPVSTKSLGLLTTSIDPGLPTNIGNDGTGNYSTSYGYWTNALGNASNGLVMDDLGIWRRVVSAKEICAIYNAGLAGQDLATVTSANLTTAVLPRISRQPVSLEVIAGSPVSFSVTASGPSPFGCQWFANGVPIEGATDTSLALSNVQPAQAGSYFVVITNSAASLTSAVATLIVDLPPSITSPPESQAVTLGQSASFSIDATGTGLLGYQWLFNGTPLVGATTAALALTNVQATDAGSYTAVVTNSWGSVTSEVATLTVNIPAGITTQPQSLKVIQGNSASFFVEASGTAPFTYQWYFNGSSLGEGATNSTLTLANIQTTDAGNYTLVVTNVAGSATSAVATLTVTKPAPAVSPTISAAVMTTNGFTFQLSVSVRQTYVILATTNLQDWTPISTNVALTDTVVFIDPATTNCSRRFYRAMVQ